ncbi:hypothetical protein RUND412_010477 [Rhizina undulata]
MSPRQFVLRQVLLPPTEQVKSHIYLVNDWTAITDDFNSRFGKTFSKLFLSEKAPEEVPAAPADSWRFDGEILCTFTGPQNLARTPFMPKTYTAAAIHKFQVVEQKKVMQNVKGRGRDADDIVVGDWYSGKQKEWLVKFVREKTKLGNVKWQVVADNFEKWIGARKCAEDDIEMD